MRKYPPLNSLRAFEAASRHLSFSKAATELAVTQSAISKQVKVLEDHLGCQLFERKHQHIALTPAAAAYALKVGEALDVVAVGTEEFIQYGASTKTLRINALPTLASRWLIPLLDEFKQKHPGIAVSMDTGDGDVDFADVLADIALRASRTGVFTGLYSEKILSEKLVPVCVPHLRVDTVKQLTKRPLIEHTSRPGMWGEFFAMMKCAPTNMSYELGLEHSFMMIQASLDGLGVALVPEFFVKKELAAGDLILAFNSEFQSPYAYYLVAAPHKVGLRKVQIFIEWLRSKAAP